MRGGVITDTSPSQSLRSLDCRRPMGQIVGRRYIFYLSSSNIICVASKEYKSNLLRADKRDYRVVLLPTLWRESIKDNKPSKFKINRKVTNQLNATHVVNYLGLNFVSTQE